MGAAAHGAEIASTQAFRNARDLGHAGHRDAPSDRATLLGGAKRRGFWPISRPAVGFTCMFDQAWSSAALASLIREARPETLIVSAVMRRRGRLSGDPAGVHCTIDAGVVGDGEPTIVPLALASVARSVDGYTQRHHRETTEAPTKTALRSAHQS